MEQIRIAGRRVVALLYRHLDLVAALLLISVTILFYRHLPALTDVSDSAYFIDDSWRFDLMVKAQHHIWLGKDVLFTYGPLFQLAFVPVFWTRDLSLGEYYKLWFVVPMWVTIILIYGAGRFLLSQSEPWKRALYFLLLVIFWIRFDIKYYIPLFIFAAWLWMQECDWGNKSRLLLYALLSAGLITAAFLVSADSGSYALASFLLVTVCYAGYRFLQRKPWTPNLALLGLTSALFSICMLLVNALFGKIWDFKYWINGYKLVSDYRWFEFTPMDSETTRVLVVTVILCFSIFIWTWTISRRFFQNLDLSPRIVAAVLFSLLVLQSCFVRSTRENVWMALFSMIALAGAFLFGPLSHQSTKLAGRLPILLALACTALFVASPNQPFSRHAWWTLWKTPVSQSCSTDKLQLDQACLSAYDFLQLRAGSEFLRQHVTASESAMVFPYENIYGDLARRRIAGGFMQFYICQDRFLLDQYFQGLDRDHPNWAIYSVDTPPEGWRFGSWPIDNVPNFTRSPEVWLYLHRHFHRVANLELGMLGLQRDENRFQRSRANETAWPATAVRRKITMGENMNLVTLASFPQDNLDFLKLRIKVHYPFWWRALKPSSMTFLIQRADGTQKIVHAFASPNDRYEVWIYPWDELQLMNYFFENPAAWRPPARPLITNISVRFDRTDWLSVAPSEFELLGVDAVHVSLQ